MPSKFGGLPVEPQRSRFGGIPMTQGAQDGISQPSGIAGDVVEPQGGFAPSQRAAIPTAGAERPVSERDRLAERGAGFAVGAEGDPAQIEAQRAAALQQRRRGALGGTETLATIGSGVIGTAVGGLAGIGASLIPGLDEGVGARTAKTVQQALTFVPRTEPGKESLAGFVEVVKPIGEGIKKAEEALGGPTLRVTDSPLAATVAHMIPTALLELIGGAGAIKAVVRPGTRLKTPNGRPTPEFELALDKKGLVFDNLTEQAKAVIPDVAGKRLTKGAEVKGAAETALVEQIKSGATDSSLAGIKVVNNRIVPDSAGLEAVRQGFDEGFVAAAKGASQGSKEGFRKMLDVTRRISKNRRLAADIRPTDIVGDSLAGRVMFIRGKANNARNELNNIANTQLKGVDVDGSQVLNTLDESLGNLNVRLVDGPGGVPRPDFEGSLIPKDMVAQKAITDAIDLLAHGGKPDALRFHNLKKIMDNMIDFNKKAASGLSDAGRNVLKDIRSSLNQSVRAVNPDYARVNDVLSSSLTTLDDFQKAVGTKIDIFGEGAAKAIGQDMRGLMSNRKSRVELENKVNQVDQVAKDLGGVFKDDIKDLAFFANSIEDRFGAVAQTSFKGEIESAIKSTGQQGVKASIAQAGLEKAAKGAEKLRGINDFNAFKAMADILKK